MGRRLKQHVLEGDRRRNVFGSYRHLTAFLQYNSKIIHFLLCAAVCLPFSQTWQHPNIRTNLPLEPAAHTNIPKFSANQMYFTLHLWLNLKPFILHELFNINARKLFFLLLFYLIYQHKVMHNYEADVKRCIVCLLSLVSIRFAHFQAKLLPILLWKTAHSSDRLVGSVNISFWNLATGKLYSV